MNATRHLGIRISPFLFEQLENTAKENFRTVSQEARLAITNHIAASPPGTGQGNKNPAPPASQEDGPLSPAP